MKYNHWLPKTLNVLAIVVNKTIYFSMSKEEVNEELLRHEKKHIEQQEKEGLLFYPKYLKEYLINLIKYRNHLKAYWNISYEIEAREAENG